MKKKILSLIAILFLSLAMPVFFGVGEASAYTEAQVKAACDEFGGGFFVAPGTKQWYCNNPRTTFGRNNTKAHGYCVNIFGGKWHVKKDGSECKDAKFNGVLSENKSNSKNSGSTSGGKSSSNSSSSSSSSGSSNSGGGSKSPEAEDGEDAKTITVNREPRDTNHCGGVETSFISCDDVAEDGSALFRLLAIVLNVVTYGVGAAAVLGVVITGYQYITARDNNVAQVAKAKNRMLQIVIGLAIWIVFWGVLQFLLPGGLFGNGQ